MLGMLGGKDILLSSTFWGFVIGIAAQIGARYGVTIDQAGLVNDIVSAIGLIMMARGRVKVTHAITSVFGIPVTPALPPAPATPAPVPGTSPLPPAAIVAFLLPGLGFALAAALSLSACANQAQQAAGQGTQVSLIQACDGYAAALTTLADARQQGRLDARAVAGIDLVRSQVTPICTAPEPAADTGALVGQVLGGTAQLNGILSLARGPPGNDAIGAGATGGVR